MSQCLTCVSKCHELKETVACLEMSRVLIIFIKRGSSCVVVFASSRTQVNMGISTEQFLSRIRYHDNFVKTKDASSRFNDRFGISNADDAVLFKCVLCADTETSCYTVQIVESSNDLVDRNYVLQCLYSITYKTSK